jgi:hypothetical protein
MIQIVARAHRQPQKKTVKAIHLLADGSSDVLLNSIALRKREMFDAFVSKERGQGNGLAISTIVCIYSCVAELLDLLSGKVVCRDGEDIGLDPNVNDDALVDESKPARKKKSTKKSKKTEIVTSTTSTATAVSDAKSAMTTVDSESNKSATLSTAEKMLDDTDLSTMDEASTRMDTSSDAGSSLPSDGGGMSLPSDGGMSLPSDGEILGVSSDGTLIHPRAHVLLTNCFREHCHLFLNLDHGPPERRELT